MELNFGPVRLLILAICIAGFAYWGGFSQPKLQDRYVRHSGALTMGWGRCVLIFLAGAVCVSLVDHRVGLMDPISIRPVYVILGIALMSGAVIWLHALWEAVKVPSIPL